MVIYRKLLFALCVSITDVAAAQSVGEIAWTVERPEWDCTAGEIDFPASLIPVPNDEAATGGHSYKSFDGLFVMRVESKPTYYGVTTKTKSEYENFVGCSKKKNTYLSELISSEYFKEKDLLICKNAGNKVLYMYEREGSLCSNIITIAPDSTDRSRFILDYQLCGPLDKYTLLTKVSEKMFNSAKLRYLGCCIHTPNWNGCKDLQ